MGVSITIHAIIPIDGEQYRKHKAVKDACIAAGVAVPDATSEFLEDSPDGPDDRSVQADGIHISVGKWSNYNRDNGVTVGDAWDRNGALVNLSKLPVGTTFLRIGTSP